MSDRAIEFERIAPFYWQARKRVTRHAWVTAHGWCRSAARRRLARSLPNEAAVRAVVSRSLEGGVVDDGTTTDGGPV